MIALTEATVRLGETVADKEEAIRRAAGLLAEHGHIAPEYAESMLGREKVANTYLGSGIAIPHGLLKDRDLIHSTGLAVVQVPDGVEWNPGETVRLVVAIAAASDEHLQILANLTQVLADEAEVAELVKTTDPSVVVRRLTPLAATRAPAPAAAGDRPRRLRHRRRRARSRRRSARPPGDDVRRRRQGLRQRRARALRREGGQRQEPRRAAHARCRAGRRRSRCWPAATTRTTPSPPSSPRSRAASATTTSPNEAAGSGAVGATGVEAGRPGRRRARHRRLARAGHRSAVAPQAAPAGRRAHGQGSARPRSRSCAPPWRRHGPSCASCTTT